MKLQKLIIPLALSMLGVMAVTLYFMRPVQEIARNDELVESVRLEEFSLSDEPQIRDEFLPFLGKEKPGTERLYTEDEVRKIQVLKDRFPGSAVVDDMIDPEGEAALERRRQNFEIGGRIRSGDASLAEINSYFDRAESQVTELLEIYRGGGILEANPQKIANLQRNLKSIRMVRKAQLKRLDSSGD